MTGTGHDLDGEGLLWAAIEAAGSSLPAAAALLGLTPASLRSRLWDEVHGRISVAALARFADLFEYDLHYEFVPRTPHGRSITRKVQPRPAPKRPTSHRMVKHRVRPSFDHDARSRDDMHFGSLSLLPGKLTILHGEKSARISPRAMLVLEALLRSDDHRLTMGEVARAGWAEDDVSMSSIRVLVHKLRNNLAAIGLERGALSLTKTGYQLRLPAQHSVQEPAQVQQD